MDVRGAAVLILGAGLVGGLVGGCAPREAQYELSETAAAAPPPRLIPTQDFAEPTAEGAAATARLGEDRSALAARAAALQGRAAALSAAPLLNEAERARLLPPAEGAP